MTTTQTTEATTSEIVEAMRQAHAAGDTDTLSSLIDILAGRGVEGDEALVAIFDELRTTEEGTMEPVPARAETYALKTANGIHIRKATKVTFTDGYVVHFTERMPQRQALAQAATERTRLGCR